MLPSSQNFFPISILVLYIFILDLGH